MIIAENSLSIFLLDDEKMFYYLYCVFYFLQCLYSGVNESFSLAGETNFPSHLVSALGSRLCAHKATRRHAG